MARTGKTEEQALNSIYIIKAYGGKTTCGYIILPKCMIGERIKIVKER